MGGVDLFQQFQLWLWSSLDISCSVSHFVLLRKGRGGIRFPACGEASCTFACKARQTGAVGRLMCARILDLWWTTWTALSTLDTTTFKTRRTDQQEACPLDDESWQRLQTLTSPLENTVDIGASPAQGSRVHANQPSASLACPLRRCGSPSESCRRDRPGGRGVFRSELRRAASTRRVRGGS